MQSLIRTLNKPKRKQNKVRAIPKKRVALAKFAKGKDENVLPDVEVVYDKGAMDAVKKSNADFVNRIYNPFRLTIRDWENPNYVATHKLSWATDENGNAVVYPNVLKINYDLHDFTNPKYNHGEWDAYDSALNRGDYVIMTPKQADWYTKNYKKYAPSFKYANGKDDDIPEVLRFLKPAGWSPDAPGAYIDNTMNPLPNVLVTNKSEYRTVPKMDEELKSIAEWVPGVGDVITGMDAILDFKNKEYLAGALGLGLLAIPNVVEKPFKKLAKPLVNQFRGIDFKQLLNNFKRSTKEPMEREIKADASKRMMDFITSDDYTRRLNESGLPYTVGDVGEMVDNRINNTDYFPAYYKELKNGALGRSEIPGGITIHPILKNDDRLTQTLDHELSHYSSWNADDQYYLNTNIPNKNERNYWTDVMKYNKNLEKPKSDLDILNERGIVDMDKAEKFLDRNRKLIDYFKDPQEVRARLYSSMLNAKRLGLSIEDYVDKLTKDGKIVKSSIDNLLYQLGIIYTPDLIKNLMNKFLVGGSIVGGAAIVKNNKE